MAAKQFAGNGKRFPGAEIIYVVDYDSDGRDAGGSSTTTFQGAIAPPIILKIANEEYPFTVSRAKQIEFFCRTDDEVRYAYVEGGTYLPSVEYRTLRPGSEKELNFGETGYFDGTIYFASSTAGAILEIEVWSSADTVDLQADGGSAIFNH
jgi:hypothetical protein